MALTRRELELMDRRRVAQARADDEAGTAFSRHLGRRQVQRITDQITAPPQPAAPAPKNNVVPLPEPRNGPPVGNKPGVEPSPLVPSVPPEAEKIAQSPVTAPTMDDAARDVAATPLNPVAGAIGQPPKRKKYGIATSALTGEMGLGNVGNVASKVLLG